MELSVNFEKLYFAFIIKYPKYIKEVQPFFFQSPEINLVFNIIKQEYLLNPTDGVPKVKRIVELVKLKDTNRTIKKEILKSILTVNLDEYSPDGNDDSKHSWLEKRVQGWLTFNNLQTGISESIEIIRNVDKLDYDNILEVSNQIKKLVDSTSLVDFNNVDNFGSSFDDVDAHVQDSETNAMSTGYPKLDYTLAGGFSVKTLNIFQSGTNQGKSLWLQNFAVNAANQGKNVIYFTLEMSEKKIMKRLGAMRLEIPINEYDDLSKNKEYMKEKIDKMKASIKTNGNMFNKNAGKIYVKEYPAGQATISDFENYCKNWVDHFQEDIDMIIVDYISIMAPEPGLGYESNLYLKGKHLAEGLRALGFKYEAPVLTAIQTSKESWGQNDAELSQTSESKAIPETADSQFAIIRTPEMKKLNLYRLKALKLRDGNFDQDEVMFDLHPKFLYIENDRYPGEA